MNRFLNGALIALVAFIVLLAGFWAVARPTVGDDTVDVAGPTKGLTGTASGTGQRPAASSGTPTSAPGPSGASAEVVGITWGQDGSELLVSLEVANPSSSDLRATALATTIATGGRTVREADRALAIDIPAGTAVPIQLRLPMPASFGAAWWDGLGDGSADLAVGGAITVQGRAGEERLAFSEQATASEPVTSRLATAAQACDDGTEVCLAPAPSAWEGGTLLLGLRASNEGDDADVHVTVRLVAGGTTLAQGAATAGRIGDDEAAALAVRLAADADGLAAWWPAHAAACEASALTVEVDVRVERDGTTETARLVLDAGTLRSGLLCGGSA